MPSKNARPVPIYLRPVVFNYSIPKIKDLYLPRGQNNCKINIKDIVPRNNAAITLVTSEGKAKPYTRQVASTKNNIRLS